MEVAKQIDVDVSLSEVQEIRWKSDDYPEELCGLLILPLNYIQGNTYPIIVDIHGGGPGANTDLQRALLVNSPLEWQLWAAKGYAVLVPELRSSGSFGSLAITRDQNKNHEAQAQGE